MNNISFPHLGLSFNIERVAFSVFGFDIYWYALCITSGIIFAYLYCSYVGKRQGISSETFIDILLWGIPSGVIGARLYYVVFNLEYFISHPDEILAIRNGGLAIYGAIIFSVLSVLIYLKVKKINVLKVFDICVIGLLIGQSMGRWGNFFNQEAFGSNTTLPWGMTGDKIKEYLMVLKESGVNVNPELPVHPTFLYESLWNLTGIIFLHILSKKKKFDGQIFTLYIIWYGLGRMIIEGLRTDSLMFMGLRISQIIGLVSGIFGVIAYIVLRNGTKRGKTNE